MTFAVGDLSLTGVPIAVVELVTALRASHPQWKVDVIARRTGALHDRFREITGVNPIVLRAADPPFHFEPFLEAIAAAAPDLVVLLGSAFLEEVQLLRWAGCRTLLWMHEGIDVSLREGYPFGDPAMGVMAQRALRSPQAVLFPSFAVRTAHEVFCPDLAQRTEVIPLAFASSRTGSARASGAANRATLRASLGMTASDVVFLCVGTLEERKRQRELVRAFRAFVQQLPAQQRAGCRLVLVGGPAPDDAASDAYSAELLHDVEPDEHRAIIFTGHVSAVDDYLALADIHVLVSTNECTPLVNMQAMLAGCLVISSAVHGIPEDVKHDDTGLLVDPRDHTAIIAALADAYRMVVTRDDRRELMIARARARITRHHDAADIARRTAAFIGRVMRAAPPGPSRDLHSPGVRRFLQEEMVLQWAIAKGDVHTETHLIARPDAAPAADAGHAAPQPSPPPTSDPTDVCAVMARGSVAHRAFASGLANAGATLAARRIVVADVGEESSPAAILGFLASANPGVVCVVGADQAEVVLLARWRGHRVLWWRTPPERARRDLDGRSFPALLERATTLAHRTVAGPADEAGVAQVLGAALDLPRVIDDERSRWRSETEAQATLTRRLAWHRAVLAHDVDTEAKTLGPGVAPGY